MNGRRGKAIRDEFTQGAEARRFFLGEMSDDERGAFESAFVADEGLFEQVRAIEDELVEAYVRGMLAPSEREQFERNFLTNARRRGRVEFTRAMLHRLTGQHSEVAPAIKTDGAAPGGPSVWYSIVSFFRTRTFAYGAAFALLALIVGGWLLLGTPNLPEVARRASPTPTAQPVRPNEHENSQGGGNVPAVTNAKSPAETLRNTNASLNANTETPNNSQNSKAPKRPADVASPVLALFAGAVRGEGKIPELNLPRGAPGATLRLHLEGQDYKVYRAELVDPDGVRVFRSGSLTARNSVINLYVPARSLVRGDYLIKVSALNPQNEPDSVADYPFRVNRK